MKKIILIIFILITAFLAYLFFSQKGENKLEQKNVLNTSEENKFFIDLDGNGEKEYVVLGIPKNKQDNYLKSLIAYNKSGEEIASLPSEISIKIPTFKSAKIHRLNTKSDEEYFSLDFIAGPHQSETMFFKLDNNLIIPICHKDEVSGPYDCLFYSGNAGYLPLKDLDKDGYLEIIETVDEYPRSGELTPEEENAINQVAEKEGMDKFAEGARIIAKREKGGRGKTVVWAIYSFNGKRFVEQTGDNYEKYYDLIGNLIENKMKKSELSKDSLEYIQFVRNFWRRND